MAVYDARLTGAGFLGDVEVTFDADGIRLSGQRAPHDLMRLRTVGQWALVVAGFLSEYSGVGPGIALVLFAPLFSVAAYFLLWWAASKQTVSIEPGASVKASTGWVFRWYHIFWLIGLIPMALLLLDSESVGRRMVSFSGPSPTAPAKSVRYVLVAKNPGDAAVLTTALLGLSTERSFELALRADGQDG